MKLLPTRRLQQFVTLWRLGPLNLLRVAGYRLQLRSGRYRRLQPPGQALPGPFFDWPAPAKPVAPDGVDRTAWLERARQVLGGELPVFSRQWKTAGFPPRWNTSLLSGVPADESAGRHWSELPDFGLRGGDVKGYWEASRFDGLLLLTQGWLCSGDEPLRQAIETWLSDWSASNPANLGLQWKCGQETGIRLLQTVLAAELLQTWAGVGAAPALTRFVAEHAARIEPTMLYAIAQDNNHGSSEAVALFVAGAWLLRQPQPRPAAARWRALGRHWLENRLQRLVMADGSFSQHSLNYHRVLLDSCSLAETLRRRWAEPAFSAKTEARCAAATRWLALFCDPHSGDGPNLGANDGARLFVLDHSAYRDFRPSLRWAARLFLDDRSASDERLAWLGLAPNAALVEARPPAAPPLQWLPQGGYARLASGDSWALLRLPRFRFRPSHADALHLDLWHRGRNLLRDGGSYSYNTEAHWLDYFSGTASHSTVQFDDRDQMPRLSRFLFGAWLRPLVLREPAPGAVQAGYRDALGAVHERQVQLSPSACEVVDKLDGFSGRAVLRWRLPPSDAPLQIDAGVCTDGNLRIAIVSSVPIARLECVDGWESLHYGEKTRLRVIEVEIRSAGTVRTHISWSA